MLIIATKEPPGWRPATLADVPADLSDCSAEDFKRWRAVLVWLVSSCNRPDEERIAAFARLISADRRLWPNALANKHNKHNKHRLAGSVFEVALRRPVEGQ